MGTGANCGNSAFRIAFNIIYIGQGYDTESIENMGECYGDFWRKVNQNQQYTACC